MSATEKLWYFFGGVLIVAAAAGFSTSFLMVLVNWPVERGLRDVFVTAAIASLFALPVVLLLGLVVAMPIAKLLYVTGLRGWRAYGAAGAGIGAAIFWLSLCLFGHADLLAAIIGALPGLVAGLYWWGTVDRHHDRNPWLSDR